MFKLTGVMIQDFEKSLRKFHQLFREGRCESWQLEELIVKAIKSDNQSNVRVEWTGRGHDQNKDIRIVDEKGKIIDIQVKSGQFKKEKIIISGHRLGRFNGDFVEITKFLNESIYHTWLTPFFEKSSENGKKFEYQLLYASPQLFQIDKEWTEITSKKGGKKYKTENKLGVEMTVSPTMSWQIWWKIPITVLVDKSRKMEID